LVFQAKPVRKDEESALWYRPPEVLVQGVADVLHCGTGDVRSLAAIDMWSIGCLFAENFLGSPLFESAETSFDLLSLHCDWLGYTYTSPDGYLEVRSPDFVEGKPKLADLVPGLCMHGYDLLAQLLACDYQQRISAEEAEKHPFFSCSCELRTCKCCNSIDQCQHTNSVDFSASSANLEERTPFCDRPVTATNFESYPSFLHSGSSDGSLELPACIQDLVVKRRLKRQRTLELDGPLVYRDAAPAV
jgi:serine/threonine protein kinase